MQIQHTEVIDDLYSRGKSKVLAEQQLHLGRLQADAIQWEQPGGAYESVSLTAPHVYVTAHLNVPGVDNGWTNASIHGVVSVRTLRSADTYNPNKILIEMRDGSTFKLDLFWEAEDHV